MVDTSQVAALLFQVKSATSPVAKVRAVMQAWQVIRAMSPHDRKKVAMEMGFEGAEGLVEQVASEHGGLPPEQIKAALRAAGSSDPADVERLVGQLRDPDSRKGVVQRGIEKLENLLVHGTVAPVQGPSSPSETTSEESDEFAEDEAPTVLETGRGEATSASEKPAPPPAVPPVPAPPGVASTAPTTGRSKVAPSGARPAPVRSRTRRSQPPAPAPEARPRTPERPVKSAPAYPGLVRAGQKAAAPVPVRDDIWTAAMEHSRRAEPASASPGPAADDEAGSGYVPGVLVRLRQVRADAAALRSASLAELREAVKGCGPEWARRRALLALIENGALSDLDQAVELIGDLASPAGRRWCVNALAIATGLDTDQRARAAAALNL